MTVALDTMCFIYAVDPQSPHHAALRKLLSESSSGKISIKVSRHTLMELSRKPDSALALAQGVEPLPYWPIGTIAELVRQIRDLSGTWHDASQNEMLQQRMQTLAKAGISIHDKGAYLDAVLSRVDVFVTYDCDFIKEGQSKVEETFGVPILSAEALVERLRL